MPVRFFRLLLCLFAFSSTAFSQTAPKREFRAAWIATVSNIDWPSRPGLPASQQQQEFIRRLDQLRGIGCNAVIVQVRPAADAFFANGEEPWSRFLTGQQGKAPEPFYDPLQFMIAETHKRHMEFHAWFNPFRALTDSRKNPNPATHITRTHPGWIINYDNKAYLNPGVPEARAYVVNIIADVTRRYDIDAVHLDDYFYPYRVPGKVFGDAGSFKQYGEALGLEDWRRQNINRFVALLYTTVHGLKSHVKVGISPFGVWRNASVDPMGSPTKGGTAAYDDLYADVRLWITKGWLDYCLPQLYWERGHRLVGFEVLMPWWQTQCFGRHMYYGLGLYRMLGTPGAVWSGTAEILEQIRSIRGSCPAGGYALYSASNLDKVRAPIRDSLARLSATIALPPVMRWLDSVAPAVPVLSVRKDAQNIRLSWSVSNPSAEPLHFAVYRFANGEKIDLERADRLLGLTDDKTYTFPNDGQGYTYAVTALDRLWNESMAGMVR